MPQSDAGPKRHHTVPVFYLRRFANPAQQVVRVPLAAGETPHRVNITKVAVERYFYRAEVRGGFTREIEARLAEMESGWAGALAALVDGDRSQQARSGVASWVAMQHLRTTFARAQSEAAAKMVGEIMDSHGGRPDDLQWHPNVHLASMLEAHPQVVDIVQRRAWTVVRFKRKALVTSDAPVVLLPVPHADESTPLGMSSNRGVYVPLDRRAGLLLTEHAFGADLPGTTADARTFNQCIAWNAYRALFHHPDDVRILEAIELSPPGEPELRYETFTAESLAAHLARRKPSAH